jgi:hypothetical protein
MDLTVEDDIMSSLILLLFFTVTSKPHR